LYQVVNLNKMAQRKYTPKAERRNPKKSFKIRREYMMDSLPNLPVYNEPIPIPEGMKTEDLYDDPSKLYKNLRTE